MCTYWKNSNTKARHRKWLAGFGELRHILIIDLIKRPFNSQLCQYLLISDFLSPTYSYECHVKRPKSNGMVFLKKLAFLQILEREKNEKLCCNQCLPLERLSQHSLSNSLRRVLNELACLTKYIKGDLGLTTVYNFGVVFETDNYCPHL